MDPFNPSSHPSVRGGRRLASPVRVTLAARLGDDLDGAWWPRTGCVARELPDLIDALNKPLGGITNISVNWASTDGSPDLDSVQLGGATASRTRGCSHQHLITLTGRTGRANLLVVPHLTTASLATMLLRRAAGKPIPAAERSTAVFQNADYIVEVARSESALFTARHHGMADGEKTKTPTAHVLRDA